MASDISLAVGDGARRMTYAELAAIRGISALSAERLVRRRHWPRQTGNDGVVRVLVPLTEARKTGGKRRVANPGYQGGHPSRTEPDIRGVVREVIREIAGSAPPDVRDDIREDDRGAVRALESAVEALREQLANADQREEAERRRAEHAERKVDELLTTLADARTAAMILGSEAAALRTQADERGTWHLLRRLRWALRGE